MHKGEIMCKKKNINLLTSQECQTEKQMESSQADHRMHFPRHPLSGQLQAQVYFTTNIDT